MKTFHCDHCRHPVFFENVECLKCGSPLAFLPDRLALCAVEPVPQQDAGLWRRKTRRPRADAPAYRMCINAQQQACNFAVPAEDPNPYCVSCRQTNILPDLSVPENHTRWYRIEVAKRRLFYTLARLGLVAVNPSGTSTDDDGNDGPVFQFLADLPGQQVLTGHANGLITLNIAEADDAERVRRRVELHEPYRTLLGHLRHESGHFYWDRLIRDGGRVDAFREVFGDESVDYSAALASYYNAGGAPAGWETRYVSAYATSHPWEDWAETWAHYLHMVDLLETASSYSTKIAVPGGSDEEAEEVANPFEDETVDFDHLVDQWIPVTLLLNSLNRSLGQEDAYPFALSKEALEKLRFVHNVIHEVRAAKRMKADAPAAAATCPAPSP
jgi:hypothetical protein